MSQSLREYLLKSGAVVVGVGQVDEALSDELSHLRRAICIGVDRRLTTDTLKRLSDLQDIAVKHLRGEGHKFLSIPPDSDRINNTFVSKLYNQFSHKVAATCSGLGWVGKNGLIINPKYGPRLSFASVLTDAPYEPDQSINECLCGECNLCKEHCPAGAISGQEWSRNKPFPQLINYDLCRELKDSRRKSNGKPNCGLCISICPYGRVTSDLIKGTSASVNGTSNTNDTDDIKVTSDSDSEIVKVGSTS